jgi:putative MFS transporter
MDEKTTLLAPSLDSVISRIGFGRYQFKLIFLSGVALFADGSEMAVLSLLTAVLRTEWHLSEGSLGMLGSSMFLGMVLGTIVSALYADDYGRLPIMKVGTAAAFISAVCAALAPEFYSFIVLRSLTGFGIGLCLPSSASYSLEICPKDYRGCFMISLELFFVAGQIFAVLMALWLIPNLEGHNWRYLLLCSAIPMGVSAVSLHFGVVESPFFYSSKGQPTESLASLSFIANTNNKPALTPQEVTAISSLKVETQDRGFSKLKTVFSTKLASQTLLLMFLWFVAVFEFYGMVFILPKSLAISQDNKAYVLWGMLVMALVQIPSTLVNMWVIESPWLGRRSTIIFCLVSQTVCLVAAVVLFSTIGFIMLIAGVYFFCGIWFNTLYPYTGELYPTQVRSLALGICNTWARLAGVLAPVVLLQCNSLSQTAPYIALGCMATVGFCVSLMLPAETRGKDLDKAL